MLEASKPLVVFFRGLNTYGDDGLHLGPFNFGPMSRHLEGFFRSQDVEFWSVEGMGSGSLDKMVFHARRWLQKAVHERSNALVSRNWHFIGHSAGGLVARILADEFAQRWPVRNVITIATPHQGAAIADHALDFSKRHYLLYWLFRCFGYDTQRKTQAFLAMTAEQVRLNVPVATELSHQGYSFTAAPKACELSWPLWWLSRWNKLPLPNDGMVEYTSQKWQTEKGPYQLDHFAQLGYSFHLSFTKRRATKKRFKMMCQDILQIIQP